LTLRSSQTQRVPPISVSARANPVMLAMALADTRSLSIL